MGFAADNVGFEVVVIRRGAGDMAGPESWTAVRASADRLEVLGVDGLTLRATDLLVAANIASDGAVPSVMNWIALDDQLNGAGQPDLALIDPVDGFGAYAQFVIAGMLTLEVDATVFLRAGFALRVIEGVTAKAGAADDPDMRADIGGNLVYLALSDVTFFAGTGGSMVLDGDGRRTITLVEDAAGLRAESGALSLSLFLNAGDPLLTTDHVTYTGIAGDLDLLQVVGIDGVTLEAQSLFLRLNAVDVVGADKLDWQALDFAEGAAALADLDPGLEVAVGGRLWYGDGTVFADATFAFGVSERMVVGAGVNGGAAFAASVLGFDLTDARVFAGVGGAFTRDADSGLIDGITEGTGFAVQGAAVQLILLGESGPAPVLDWTAVSVRFDRAEFTGLPPEFVIRATDVLFEANLAASDGSKLDWSALTLDGADVTTATGLDRIAGLDAGSGIAFGGTLDLQIDGAVLIYATIAGQVRTADVTDAPLVADAPGEGKETVAVAGAQILTLSLTGGQLFAGTGGAFTLDAEGAVTGVANQGTGFAASDIYLDLISVAQTPVNPLTPAVEARPALTWSALQAGASEVSIRGIDQSVLRLAVYDLAVATNAAAADGSKIDWTQLDNGDDDAAFAGNPITDADAGITDTLVFAIGAAIEVGIADNELALGRLDLDTAVQTITDGTITVANAQVLVLNLSGVGLFAGAGGAFTLDADTGRATGIAEQGTGFRADGAALNLVIVSDGAPGLRSYTALSAEAAVVAALGLPEGFAARASDLSVAVNIADGSVQNGGKLDWTRIARLAGSPIGEIDSGLDISFGGAIEFELDGVVLLAGAFAGSVRTEDVTDGIISLTAAQVLRLQVAGGYVFAGVGGAFLRDDDGAVIGVADQGTGFAAEGVAIDLLLVNEAPTVATPRGWLAVVAEADSVAPRGLPAGLEIAVSNIFVAFNGRDAGSTK